MTELYHVLGQVTYSFSRIDFLISSIAYDFNLTESPYIYFANSRFADKLTSFGDNLSKQFTDAEIINEIDSWIYRLQELRKKRNNLVHSVILSYIDNHEEIVFYNYRMHNKILEREVDHYSLTDLNKLNVEFVNAHNDGYTLFTRLKALKLNE